MPPINSIAQLQLALSILSGRHSSAQVTPEEAELLVLKGEDYDEADVLQAVEEILFEYLSPAVPGPLVDNWQIAELLIHQIADAGGTLDPREVKVDPRLIESLVEDGVILKGLTGLRLGKNAERALDDIARDRENQARV